MPRLNSGLSTLTGILFSLSLGLATAQAQEFVTFLNFQGTAFITDNPPSATCQAAGFSFGDNYVVVYLFSLNPASVADALSFSTGRGTFRIVSTSSPHFSLNGPSPVDWNYINGRATDGTLTGSSSDLKISSGFNLPVDRTTQIVRIYGTVNDFIDNPGCTVHINAGLVVRPNP